MFIKHYNKYKDKIYNHFVYRVGDLQTAEDLASTTFLKAYDAFDRYDDTYAFSTWIYTIAHRVLVDHYRKQGREFATDFDDRQDLDAPDERSETIEMQFDKSVTLEHIHEAFDALSESNARCMTYRYVDDLSTKEIADLLETTEAAIRQRLSRSVKAVRNHLATHYPMYELS